MSQIAEPPGISAGGLVTVAFLKAQLDAGSDHLGMFLPLVLDVISRLPLSSFTAQDVQVAISSIHNVAMPRHVVATLLRRASKTYITGEGGLYRRIPGADISNRSVEAKKEQIERAQHRLAESLMLHAQQRKLRIDSVEDALEKLFKFLESQQVALLLETPTKNASVPELSDRECSVVAEFIECVVAGDPALLAVLRGMLEGLVLYHAAFLPDLNNATQRFRNLRVVFDSPLVREALGYEGAALKSLLKEAIEVLKASGVECAVFEDTLKEIKRLLAMYEARLGTTQGRAELKPSLMTRHFLTQGYAPSDVAELSTFLERDTVAAGFHILPRPPRQPEFTAGEKELAARLKRPNSGPEVDMEPRIVHDVECVAGVLTLRRGRRSYRLEDAGVVFATDSATVIRTVQEWWKEDEKETTAAPIVHIRSLTNLAWLKKPGICGDFKIQELVVLCTAALQPQHATWERFLRHLSKLQQSQRITSDEAAAILVSDILDRTLKGAELASDDPAEVDAATLDEAVERVKAAYAAEASRKVQVAETEKAAAVAAAEERISAAVLRADAAERSAAEAARKRAVRIRERADRWAGRLTTGVGWGANLVLAAGAFALLSEHRFHPSAKGIVLGFSLMAFIAIELLALRREVSSLLGHLNELASDRLLDIFGIED